jgi:ubiquitin-protein ligase
MNQKKADKMIRKFGARRKKEAKNNYDCKEFKFSQLNDFTWYFKFTIEDGVYANQVHIIEMKLHYGQFPEKYVYPLHAPLCRFITPIYHPNISKIGTICLDILKNEWAPTFYTSTIITALKVLLLNPQPDSPQNSEAAKLLLSDEEAFLKKLKDFYDYNSSNEAIRKMFD